MLPRRRVELRGRGIPCFRRVHLCFRRIHAKVRLLWSCSGVSPKSSSLVCSTDGRSYLWLTPQVPHCEERQGAAHSRRGSQRWDDSEPMFGIFQDVRFYPILNFGHFWAPLFSRCFFPMMNLGHFWAPLAFDLPQIQ